MPTTCSPASRATGRSRLTRGRGQRPGAAGGPRGRGSGRTAARRLPGGPPDAPSFHFPRSLPPRTSTTPPGHAQAARIVQPIPGAAGPVRPGRVTVQSGLRPAVSRPGKSGFATCRSQGETPLSLDFRHPRPWPRRVLGSMPECPGVGMSMAGSELWTVQENLIAGHNWSVVPTLVIPGGSSLPGRGWATASGCLWSSKQVDRGAVAVSALGSGRYR